MSPAFHSPEIALIVESVEHANARIKFFRIAFGSSSPGQMVSETDARTIVKEMTVAQRFSVDWAARGDQQRDLVKLAFLLIQCMETAMPRGGNIEISAIGEEWAVCGTADQLQIDADLWHLLATASDTVDIPASKVQFVLAPMTAAKCNRKLVVESGEKTIRVRF